MKNMANKMKQNKESGDKKQMEEDIKAIRQLLENLVGLSCAGTEHEGYHQCHDQYAALRRTCDAAAV